ncbi:MAG: hypothetical protein ACXIVQ_13755 [Acidimicrobiales bacterium]
MRGSRRIVALALVLLLGAAACGEGTDGDAGGNGREVSGSGSGEAAETDPDLPPFCDDIDSLRPDEMGSEPFTRRDDDVAMRGVLATYLAEHDDTSGGLWIDRITGGYIVAFTDDADAHLEAILERRPSSDDIAVVEPRPEITETTTVGESGVPVGVVEVRWTATELETMASDAAASLLGDPESGVQSVGVMHDRNRVFVGLQLADDAGRSGIAERFPVGAVCVEGPTERPEPVDAASVDLMPEADPDPMVRCMSYPFRVSALDAPLGFEDADHPVAEALRRELDSGSTDMGVIDGSGWRLLAEDDARALVAHGDPIVAMISFERMGDAWVWAGSSGGECERLRLVVPESVSEVRWGLDPERPDLDADGIAVEVLVNETACTGGESIGDRLIGPQIRYTDDEVIVAFAAVPLEAGAYTCQGNPRTRVTIELEEPLGDRDLVDAFDAPPRQPVGLADVW